MKRSHIVGSILLLCCAGMARAAETAPPKGYAIVRKTDFGRVMSVVKEGQKNVSSAIEGVLNDLDDYFDDDYTVGATFEDQRDHKSGFTIIQAKYNGQAVHGFVTAGLSDKGATAMVIFCNNSAPPAAWAELTGRPAARRAAGPAPVGGAPATQPVAESNPDPETPPPAPKLTAYQFPDGTGVVGLADGWHTDAQSCQNGFIINGPDHSHVAMGIVFTVNTPNSMAVQMARQYGTGGRPLLVSPMKAPADAFEALAPQISRFAEQTGKSGFEVDHVAKVKDMPPQGPGNQIALITYGVTKKQGDDKGHYQALAEISCTPLTEQAWMMWVIEASASDATAKAQMPAMIAMINSWRLNQQVVNANTQRQIGAQKDWFAAQQAGQRAQSEANDAQHAQYWKDTNARSRVNDNFDEGLRGVRDLEDTTTGELHSIDLGSIDQLQAKLNEVDPDRWKQVPLRDKVDPLPGNR